MLFRFFDQLQWAQEFCRGNLRLSTLQQWADAEGRHGDRCEGVRKLLIIDRAYQSRPETGWTGDDSSLAALREAQSLGAAPHFPNGSNIIIENHRVATIVDRRCWGLSFTAEEWSTEKANELQRPWGVRIVNPQAAVELLLNRVIQVAGTSIEAALGPVVYCDDLTNEVSPGQSVFRKLRNPFEREQEWRLIIVPQDAQRATGPLDVSVPDLAQFCFPVHSPSEPADEVDPTGR